MRTPAPLHTLSLLLALLAGLLLAYGAGPARADALRYWSFWQREAGADGWTYATQGPATARPGDGDSIGFRFAASEDSPGAARPRGAAGFAAVCGDAPGARPARGTKRVAVVLDFGTAADAPGGATPPPARTACARVRADATAGEALAAVAKPLRYDSTGLLCAIAGYPESGCTGQADGGGGGGGGGGGPSAGLIGGIAAVAVLGAAAVWQARRRRP
ncbi:SCO2322 family protein [Streptomyces sp. B1866]|uniref:SCO2322 family protein n=1 Tax=Streptomyces sp. B1866 TaxID=3075431 RepID=UPI00288C840E|nr:SCO2322 family protein [Streptomyces sp. B1866]MDT3399805.1 SCO2322 family protein [Streptomyces sp. B1866]